MYDEVQHQRLQDEIHLNDWRDNTFEMELLQSVLKKLNDRLETEPDSKSRKLLIETILTVKNTILELSS